MTRFTTTAGRFKGSSKRLVDHFGMLITYNHIGKSEYDVETQMVTNTTKSVSVKAFLTQPKYRESKSPNLVGRTGSVVLIAKADLDFIPKLEDILSTNDGELTVVERIAYNAGKDTSMWRLLCTSS